MNIYNKKSQFYIFSESAASTISTDSSVPSTKRKAAEMEGSSSDSVGLRGSARKRRRLLRLDHHYR